MAKNKDFTDNRVTEKQRQLDKRNEQAKQAKKALQESKRETQASLDSHQLGWVTADEKEI